jgi:hypothetical protein
MSSPPEIKSIGPQSSRKMPCRQSIVKQIVKSAERLYWVSAIWEQAQKILKTVPKNDKSALLTYRNFCTYLRKKTKYEETTLCLIGNKFSLRARRG